MGETCEYEEMKGNNAVEFHVVGTLVSTEKVAQGTLGGFVEHTAGWTPHAAGAQGSEYGDYGTSIRRVPCVSSALVTGWPDGPRRAGPSPL